jgi:hypothetical protein
MQETQAYNGFELLCSELALSMDELNARILETPQKLLDQVQALENEALVMPLQQDLLLKGSETAFITSGTDLHQHLAKLIQRMARGAELKAPPMIAPTEEITAFLQEKVKASFSRLMDGVIRRIKIGYFAKAYDRDRELKTVTQHFGELVSRYLAKPLMLSPFLRAFTHKGPLDLIENNTHSAFVAMGALRNHDYCRNMAADDRQRQLIEIGLSMLFQDVSLMIDGGTHRDDDPEHALASADIARQIGLPANCSTTIRHHHRTMDEDGAPLLKIRTPSLSENMAAVTNAFVHCLTTSGLGLDVNQSLYILSYYADGGYFAKDCVQALGRACVGEVKQQIIIQALRIIRQCPNGERPFLWDVRTAIPNRFLCRHSDCPHLTNETVILYEGVHFDGPGAAIDIPKGGYCKCGYLTNQFNRWLLKHFQSATTN